MNSLVFTRDDQRDSGVREGIAIELAVHRELPSRPTSGRARGIRRTPTMLMSGVVVAASQFAERCAACSARRRDIGNSPFSRVISPEEGT